ncbi:MAG: hypothetical protein JWM85_1233 [Acidimicrobiaceae bacterium]|nr:hypothetical protein [Acidimicrobiaceae bacterium]
MRSDAITDVEREWVELVRNPAEIPAVRDALVARGISASKAAGIVLWLSDQAARRRLIRAATASEYRNTLRALGFPGPAQRTETWSGSSVGRARA